MTRPTRSSDWGFPRWRGYGAEREAVQVKLCDRYGCERRGECPAPKSPNSPERWLFCQEHAAEYNRGWDYFQGLSDEEAAERERTEQRDASGFAGAKYYGWGGAGDGSRSRDEMLALATLGLESDADFDAIRAAWRALAKENHPDLKPGDAAAAQRFREIQAAYDVLRVVEEGKSWQG